MYNLILALASGILGGAIVFAFPRLGNRVRNAITSFFCMSALFFSWRAALGIFSGRSIALSLNLGGLNFTLAPDPLGAIFSLIISTMWLFAAIYSMGYMEGKPRLHTYYGFLLISLSVALGVSYAGNLLALYLFYELLTFATYPLVIHDRSEQAMKAGKQYIFYNLVGAGLILIAIVMTTVKVGNLNFSAQSLLQGQPGGGMNILLLLFIAGFGVKAAIMPLHRWLPKAMAAPTPISALLHAVAVVYAGVFGVLRVVYSVFGKELISELIAGQALKWVAVITIVFGIIIALRQDTLKRRLAYQTISHLSYILLGAFVFTEWGLGGAVFQMIAYSLLKVSLFFCAGIIAEKTGKTKISQMQGVGYRLPITMAVFSIATLGMVGMLPLATFWSKFYLMKGSVESGFLLPALALIFSGILNAVCFIPMIVSSFKGDRDATLIKRDKSFYLMLVPTIVLVLGSIVAGFWPGSIWYGVTSVVNSFFH